MTHFQTNTKGRCGMHPEEVSERELTPREELDFFAAEMSKAAEDTQHLAHKRQLEAEALFARAAAARAAADSAHAWLNDTAPKTAEETPYPCSPHPSMTVGA